MSHASERDEAGMHVRRWAARTAPERVAEYVARVREVVLPHLRRSPGYVRAIFLQRASGNGSVEVVALTFWESLEAAQGLAEEEGEEAYVPPEIAATLEEFDQQVVLHRLLLEDTVDDWPLSPRS